MADLVGYANVKIRQRKREENTRRHRSCLVLFDHYQTELRSPQMCGQPKNTGKPPKRLMVTVLETNVDSFATFMGC